jgi:hypothetical protein
MRRHGFLFSGLLCQPLLSLFQFRVDYCRGEFVERRSG